MYLKILVTPHAKKETLKEIGNNRLQISVKERAERNMANSRVRELVSEHLKVPLTGVRIISGHQNPSKMISVADKYLG
ncbi:hypothetical protein COB55_02755 [Candidatus Wolfebacteria bacterium]|nr:MAG: hypothetical protein COB55_02755 [Candidatus Wolfebacteria bacterium]